MLTNAILFQQKYGPDHHVEEDVSDVAFEGPTSSEPNTSYIWK